MSLGGNIGAEAAAEEILRHLDTVKNTPGFNDFTPAVVLMLVQAKVNEIYQAAKEGWY
jgi:hypothetical protein